MSVQAFAKAVEQASQADVVSFGKPPPLVVQPVPAGTNVVTSKPLVPRLKSEENNILTLTQFLLVIKGTWGLSIVLAPLVLAWAMLTSNLCRNRHLSWAF